MAIEISNVVKIIPTYNERDNVEPLARLMFSLHPEISLMFVDDNSPDGTASHVQNLANEFPKLSVMRRSQDRGFGKSYVDGFKKILVDDRYQAIVMMDADFSHDPIEIPAMVATLARCDVVVGSRYVPGGNIENWNWKRRLLSKFANFYARTILRVPTHDMTTGYMCLRKSVLNHLDLSSIKSEGYAFLVELKYRIHQAGFEMVEHPITFHERREGQSKMSRKIIVEAMFLPWRLRFSKK